MSLSTPHEAKPDSVPGRTAMRRPIGFLLVIVSASSFGTLAIFYRYAYADGMDSLTILFIRFTVAAVLMLILLALRRERVPRGGVLLRLIGMGALGYVGQAFSYLTALKYASAGLVALLLYLYPVFVAILSVVWMHERITPVKIIALCLALAGLALTVGPGGGQPLGAALAIAAAAIYSVYIIVGSQVMKMVSAVQSAAVIFTSAGAVYGVLAAAGGIHPPASGTGWLAMAGVIVIATVLPVLAFLAGLERVGATNASMLSTIEPVVTVLLAGLLLGETLPPIALLGGGLILAAVLILTRGELGRGEASTPEQVKKDSGD